MEELQKRIEDISIKDENKKEEVSKEEQKVEKKEEKREEKKVTQPKKGSKFVKPKKTAKVGFMYDEILILHKNHNTAHVECPERILSIYFHLFKAGLIKRCVTIPFSEATDEEILLAHSPDQVKNVKAVQWNVGEGECGKILMAHGKNTRRYSTDTYENSWTTKCAYLSCGSVIEAVRSVSMGLVNTVFCNVRPPGHHAGCNHIGGFCFINNVAVAAKVAQKECGIKKILIFDWDVHHGDGTQDIFYRDDSVLFISLHQYDDGYFYPGTIGSEKNIGEEKGEGFNINVPWNVNRGTKEEVKKIGDHEYVYIFEHVLRPIITSFDPELILVSSGFDSAKGDLLGDLEITPHGYGYLVAALKQCCPKMVVALEGGYNIEAIAASAEGVVRSLLGEELPFASLGGIKTFKEMVELKDVLSPAGRETAFRVIAAIEKYWPILTPIKEKLQSNKIE